MIVIFLILLLLFGAKKLPELGAGLGKGIRSLKEGLSGAEPDSRPPHQEASEGGARSEPPAKT